MTPSQLAALITEDVRYFNGLKPHVMAEDWDDGMVMADQLEENNYSIHNIGSAIVDLCERYRQSINTHMEALPKSEYRFLLFAVRRARDFIGDLRYYAAVFNDVADIKALYDHVWTSIYYPSEWLESAISDMSHPNSPPGMEEALYNVLMLYEDWAATLIAILVRVEKYYKIKMAFACATPSQARWLRLLMSRSARDSGQWFKEDANAATLREDWDDGMVMADQLEESDYNIGEIAAVLSDICDRYHEEYSAALNKAITSGVINDHYGSIARTLQRIEIIRTEVHSLTDFISFKGLCTYGLVVAYSPLQMLEIKLKYAANQESFDALFQLYTIYHDFISTLVAVIVRAAKYHGIKVGLVFGNTPGIGSTIMPYYRDLPSKLARDSGQWFNDNAG